jgi:hypothetical protein
LLIDRRNPAAVELEMHENIRMQPDRAAAGSGIRRVAPRHQKGVAAAQLAHDDDLQVGKGTVIDIDGQAVITD